MGGLHIYFLFLYSVVYLPFIVLIVFLPHPLQIRGIRSKIGSNECLLCCIDFLFHIVETLVRFFNKYAYVQVSDVYLFTSFQDIDHAYVKSLHVPAVFCLSFVSPH